MLGNLGSFTVLRVNNELSSCTLLRVPHSSECAWVRQQAEKSESRWHHYISLNLDSYTFRILLDYLTFRLSPVSSASESFWARVCGFISSSPGGSRLSAFETLVWLNGCDKFHLKSCFLFLQHWKELPTPSFRFVSKHMLDVVLLTARDSCFECCKKLKRCCFICLS